jgi:hypothetical protein
MRSASTEPSIDTAVGGAPGEGPDASVILGIGLGSGDTLTGSEGVCMDALKLSSAGLARWKRL